MTIQHYYSDINGFQIDSPRLHTPTEAEIKLVIANGKIIKPEYNMFSDGTIIEVKRSSITDMLTRSEYRDMYRIIN